MTDSRYFQDLAPRNSARPGLFLMGLWLLLTIVFAGEANADTTLRAGDILPDIEAALMERGMPNDATIELNDADALITFGTSLNFQHVSYNTTSGRFVIRLEGAAPIAGRIVQRMSMPVLKRNIERGEMIAETDVDYREFESADIDRFASHGSDIFGKEARRPLRAGGPVRTSDLAEPMLVRKGKLVTVLFEKDGMRLSQQGVAQSNGAAGDLIAIRNVKSDRVIKGVVDNVNLVRILTISN